ncbi:ubiquinone biosynthesis O-methyltransferase-like [Chironomus tepperi]|uniref:ubiquinone biosynthesis O-methyltransferase-like n=1 Tax=Chironomus tepperi TaxID=113505 RepID=UPI00391FB07B
MAEVKSSVIKSEVDRYSSYAHTWWNPNGRTYLLHKMIPAIRIPFMKSGLTDAGLVKNENKDKSNMFEGIKILDVGSGGGLMAEPLALMGAQVTGVDPTENLVDVAKEHMKIHENLKINYICDTIENYSANNKEQYDVVTFFDVAEHVADVRQVLKASVENLKPGGQIFITTWNKTFMGWLYGIVILQWILGIVPPGAHKISMFISHQQISEYLKEFNCKTVEVRGVWYSLWKRDWSFTNYTGVWYAMRAVKEE